MFCSIVLHRYCTFFFYKFKARPPPPEQIFWLSLLHYLLYCSGLERNPPDLPCLPVITWLQINRLGRLTWLLNYIQIIFTWDTVTLPHRTSFFFHCLLTRSHPLRELWKQRIKSLRIKEPIMRLKSKETRFFMQ